MEQPEYAWYEFGIRLSQADRELLPPSGAVGSNVEERPSVGRMLLRRLRNAAELLPSLSQWQRQHLATELDGADAAIEPAALGDHGAYVWLSDAIQSLRTFVVESQLSTSNRDAFNLGWRVPRLRWRTPEDGGGPGNPFPWTNDRYYRRVWMEATEVAELLKKFGLQDSSVLFAPEQWSREVQERLGPASENPTNDEQERWMIEEGLLLLKPVRRDEVVMPQLDVERRLFIDGEHSIPLDENEMSFLRMLFDAGPENVVSSISMKARNPSLPDRLDRLIKALAPRVRRWIGSRPGSGYWLRSTPES